MAQKKTELFLKILSFEGLAASLEGGIDSRSDKPLGRRVHAGHYMPF